MTANECFICMDKSRAAFRVVCVERGFHRPVGPELEHHHPTFRAIVRECGDCETLVVDETIE